MDSLCNISSAATGHVVQCHSPVIVIVVASVTVYVRVPCVKIVGDGQTVV
jgi:hypothetical protein